MHKHICLLSLLALMLTTSCKNESTQNTKGLLTKIPIDVEVNGELTIKNCARWYLNFDYLKRTVIFDHRIISMSGHGGFLCFHEADISRDTLFEQLLNTDFYDDIAVFQDTLFSEKSDRMYWWNKNKWEPYLHPYPIKYFDLIEEDSNYAFYYSDGGEFGSILFAYNKINANTKALYSGTPNTIFPTDSGYFVGSHSYHMRGSSYAFIVRDVEQWKDINPELRHYETMFDRDKRFFSIMDTSIPARQNLSEYWFRHSNIKNEDEKEQHIEDHLGIMLTGSFIYNDRIYHIVNPKRYDVYGFRYIGTVQNDSLIKVDSLYNCSPRSVYKYGNSLVINQASGVSIMRGDTLFQINLHTIHPSYRGPTFEWNYVETDSTQKPDIYIRGQYNNDDFWNENPPDPQQPYFEIHALINAQDRIDGYEGNNSEGTYITIGKHRKKLIPSFYAFTIVMYEQRLFVIFRGLNLIEITDMNLFLEHYAQ